MKRKTMKITVLTIVALMLIMTGCYTQIGDLTILANRNIDSKTNYKLIERYKVAKAKAKNQDALEQAIDKAVKEVDGGEFMKNVKIYVKNNGRKVKVEGDVWGLPNENVKKSVEKSVTAKIEFKVGDNVTFKNMGKLVEGKIIGVNQNTAVIKFTTMLGQEKNKEVEYEKLTKIGE